MRNSDRDNSDMAEKSKAAFNPGAHIDYMAPLLGLTITPEQRPGVEQFLNVAQGIASFVATAPLADDDLILANVFTPGAMETK